ncbi:LSU m5C1962 methyl transferase RlmI [Salmonella enterica subsp. enterica]|nr:LSU m5C1962 methyl transferase RlmI [Salmonella enterica subsp. enterica]
MALTQGPVTGELPPALLPIEEHGMKLLVDIQGGHKTGYYLDQRDSRLATRRYVENQRVLNCFFLYRRFCRVGVNGRLSPRLSAWIPHRMRWISPGKTLN